MMLTVLYRYQLLFIPPCHGHSFPNPSSQRNYFAHLQAYAAELSEGNHLQCANSSKPLLTAVDSLVTYANSPEFARVPAKISAEVSSPFSIYIRVSVWPEESVSIV